LAVAIEHPEALIIASDQVAVLDDEIMTKPHTHENAIYQLNRSSGNTVTFLTSLCLLNSKTGQHQVTIVPYSVEFLPLTQGQISAYLLKEQPYQCAGSFKSEGLGITLFKRFEGDDPNSLIGLPLIALTEMLRKEGVEPLIET
jgi:septum formation protein